MTRPRSGKLDPVRPGIEGAGALLVLGVDDTLPGDRIAPQPLEGTVGPHPYSWCPG